MPKEVGTMRWFGRSFDAPAWEYMSEVPTPVGEACAWCEEEIAEGDAGVTMPHFMTTGVIVMPYHVECHMRQSLGGLAHWEGRCVCHGGSDEPGEPGMSPREEARLVVDRFWGPGWLTRP